MEEINIPILSKLKAKNKPTTYVSKCYYETFFPKNRRKSLHRLLPIKDVFVFNGMCRVYEITEKKKLFDENVNFEIEINKYCNGFKEGYKAFTDKASKDVRYIEKEIFETAIYFPHYCPHTYKNDKIIPQEWDTVGEKVGRFYAAWCIVLEYQNNFEPRFKERYKQPQQLPEELQTDEAKALFQKAIDAGFVEANGNLYRWNGSRPQLAYFAELASEYLNTDKFKPYEIAFGKNNLAQEKWKNKEERGAVKRQNEIEILFK